MWNVRERTMDGIPRTNNKLEGLHRGMQSMFTCAHPTMWKFFGGLRKEHALHYTTYVQALGGEQPPKQNRRYKDCNNRLQNLIDREGEGEITKIEFLKGVAHNLTLNV